MNVQNVLNQKINKRIVKKMLEQASKYNVDIQPVEQSTDLTSNYNFLMKTANLIYLLLSDADLTIKRDYANLNEQFGQNYEDDSANPFSRFAFDPGSVRSNRSRADTIGTLESSVPGTRSSYSSGSYGLSRASRPFYRPGSYQGSEAPSLPPSLPYNNPRINYPIPNYGRVIPPNPYDDGDTISELSDESYFPDLSEESFYQNNKGVSINTTQLEREAVNLKFYTEQMLGQFNLLTKPQKERLRKIIIKITNQINLINQKYPNNPALVGAFKLIKSTFSTINDELTKSGERTIVDSGEYETDESIGAGRVNKGIYNLHQPSKYVNFNNVNANWSYNLAQRNN
jgi:hypothetical protein